MIVDSYFISVHWRYYLFHRVLAPIIADEQSAFNLTVVLFSLDAFKIFSLPLLFCNLISMCLGMGLFIFIFDAEDSLISWIYRFMIFFSSRNSQDIIWANLASTPLFFFSWTFIRCILNSPTLFSVFLWLFDIFHLCLSGYLLDNFFDISAIR